MKAPNATTTPDIGETNISETSISEMANKLQQHRATMPVWPDLPAMWTDRQITDHMQRVTQVDLTRTYLLDLPGQIERERAKLADRQARKTLVTEKAAQIDQQLAESPDWRSFSDGRQRDKEYDRQQDLKRQHQLLREGRLYRPDAPGEMFERADGLDALIRESEQRIAAWQAHLDAAIATADQLLAAAAAS